MIASNTLALGPGVLSADTLVKAGLAVILLIVFAESGLLVGFFLPGDSVLFTLGLFIAKGQVTTPLWLACALIAVAAIAGDQVGYLFGRKVGPALFRRPNSRLFKQENVEKAHAFFERNGPRSLVLARFVPVVRTFTPIIAGVSRMNYRSFVLYNVIGGLLWGCGVTTLGYYLGKIAFVHQHIEVILILIVLVSVVPVGAELLRGRLMAKRRAGQEPRDPRHPEDARDSYDARDAHAARDTHDTHGARDARYLGADPAPVPAPPAVPTPRPAGTRRGGGGRHSAARHR
jgi:membrane-associated protein